jgi:hypothetical protein
MDIAVFALTKLVTALLSRRLSDPLAEHRSKQRTGKAYAVLSELEKLHVMRSASTSGDICYIESATDNFLVARRILEVADGEIITAAFHADSSFYSAGDFIPPCVHGRNLRRITSKEMCPPESEASVRCQMENAAPGARLVVLNTKFAPLDGVFCKFSDKTYLCFLAIPDSRRPARSSGWVITKGTARQLYEHYDALCTRA